MMSSAICQSEAFTNVQIYVVQYTPFISNAIDESTITVPMHNLDNVCSYDFDGFKCFNHIM